MIIVLGAIATYLIGLAVWVYVWGYVAGKRGKSLFHPSETMAREEWWALAGLIWPAIVPTLGAIAVPCWLIKGTVIGMESIFNAANKAAIKVHERKLELESPEVPQTSLTKERATA